MNKSPRVVRNFWIEGNVAGKAVPLTGGPVAKDGGFHLSVLMREDGKISQNRLVVMGVAESDGTLTLSATLVAPDRPGVKSVKVVTSR